MKLLIAVMTCHRLDYFIDDQTTDWLNSQGLRYLNVEQRVAAQRATWLSSVPCEVNDGITPIELHYKFFYGQQLRRLDVKPNQRVGTGGPAPQLRTALTDEVYLPCGDGYIFNSAKMKEMCRYALHLGYDYILRVDDDTFVNLPRLLATDFAEYDYSGSDNGAFHPGSCMFLSRAAMEHVVKGRITNYADDLWVGQMMENAGIPRHDIPSIHHGFGRDYAIRFDKVKDRDFSSLHSCTPDVMRKLWTRLTTLSSAPQKDTDGTASEPTQSVSASQVSEAEKLYLAVTSPTQQGIPLPVWDSSLSRILPLAITQLSSDSASSATGSLKTNTTSDSLSTVTSET